MIFSFGFPALCASHFSAALAISWSRELLHPFRRTCSFLLTIAVPKAAMNWWHKSESRGTSRKEPPTNMRMVLLLPDYLKMIMECCASATHREAVYFNYKY